ncbi:serine protease inhibitor Cvsi-2-like [Saccostrea cucullata]|uniref:serine protease inhibitor Cvsi-2-like n=1 Tax=Saccostrea cuccullata TaxID=36930 RepID=UPI002ED1E694
MKATILCITLLIVAVASERCTFFHHECTTVSCSEGAPHCVLGQCTCTHNTAKACTSASDCTEHCLAFGNQHCVDGECHCPFDNIIPGGLGGFGN